MTRLPSLFALATVLIATPVSIEAQQGLGRDEAVFTWADRVAAGNWIRVYNFNGRIDVVEGSGPDVQVRAEKMMDEEDFGDVTFEVQRDAGGVTICAIHRERAECDEDGLHQQSSSWWRDDGNRNAKVAIRITVPARVNVRARTGNGDLTARRVGGEIDIRSGNGKVEVTETAGRVVAHTGNGAVTVDRAGGPVDVRTGNGRITVVTASGPVVANTGNGEIDVTMNAIAGADDMSFRTGNGDVTITLPPSIDADLELRTGHGTVSTDFPITVNGRLNPRQLRGRLGKGGRSIRVTSGNGDIELRRGS
ncbi:MAG TPA: DUF4097 family beta strand repeat-containing protein [Gemmatimonadaceae bacterium]|nr:DUF4097 family beta strand repeat-containing protein [Gemmatimonadaceae bacterium]